MNCLDLFTGIGGFAVAGQNVGIKHLGFCEIDATCRKVLNRHFPNVRIYNNVETITEEFESTESIDIITGGFPCQDLSVAGRRAGLSGKRSGLWFEMLRTIEHFKPRWVIAENVPGLLSGCGCTACQGVGRLIRTHARIRRRKGGSPCAVCVAGKRMLESHSGRNFTTILQGLVKLGYGVSYRIFDSQFDGVAQRRQRVFIVASLGSGDSAEVLFEREGGAWDPPPSREKGQRPAPCLESSANTTGGTRPPGSTADTAASLVTFGLIGHEEYSNNPATLRAASGDAGGGSEHLIALGGNNQSGPVDVATACNAHGGTGRIDFESETFIAQISGTLNSGGNQGGFRTEPGEHLIVAEVAQTLTASYSTHKGSTAGENGGTVNLQIVPLQEVGRRTGKSTDDRRQGIGIGDVDDPMYTLQSGAQHGVCTFGVQDDNQNGVCLSDIAGTLRSDAPGHQPGGTLAFTERARADGRNLETSEELAYSLTDASKGGNPHSGKIAGQFGVRRITPRECERLQAYPDDFTRWDADGNEISDSARYRMLGNAVCTTTVEWILRRIAMIESRQSTAPRDADKESV